MRLMIDPGHGGHDPGAVGQMGTREADVALAVSLMIAGMSHQGHFCKLTRYDDTFIELDDRCAMSNQFDPDAFVSVHCNAAENQAASGFEIWTSPGLTDADPLASRLWLDLHENFPSMRARLDMSDGDEDKEAPFRVLVGTKSPAVLIELGFISNLEEEHMLASPAYQIKIAGVIYRCLEDYYG